MASPVFVVAFVLLVCFAGASVISAQNIDDSTFDRTETRGNTTFGCFTSGPCSPCTYTEKSDEEKYHCSISGYRQAYRCVELQSTGLNDDNPKQNVENRDEEQNEVSSRSRKTLNSHRLLQVEQDNNVDRRTFEAEDVTTHDGRQIIHVYYSCLPTDSEETIGVLGFEGIMLGLLALSASVIYHRKRRNFALSGMTRLPTNSRF